MDERVGRTLRGVVVALVVLLGAAGFVLTHADAQPEAPAEVTPTSHEVLPLTVREVRRPRVYHGVIQASDRALLSFTEGGRLEAREVEIGDHVTEGTPLARLDARGHHNAVHAARASAREAAAQTEQLERDQARSQRLREGGVNTQAQLEQVETGLLRANALGAQARANLAESERRRADSTLRAPFAGVITDVLVEPGELVQPGQPIVRIAGESTFEVILQVQAELAAELHEGDAVALAATGLDASDPLRRTPLLGTVRARVSSAAALDGLYPVVVDVQPDDNVRAGVAVEATLYGASRHLLEVPLIAIVDPSGRRPFVWKVVDGVASRAFVRVGELDGEWVEIREGLEPGAEIVVRGHARLLEGDLIRPSTESTR